MESPLLDLLLGKKKTDTVYYKGKVIKILLDGEVIVKTANDVFNAKMMTDEPLELGNLVYAVKDTNGKWLVVGLSKQ